MKNNPSKPAHSLRSRTFAVAVLVCLLLSAGVYANNITVSNLSLTGQNTTGQYSLVQFNISWENSWRTSSAPNNWDAAWVFVKYKVSGGTWNHATLNSSGHTAPTGSTITPSSDGIGVFIYRSADGTGTFTKTGVQLRWNYGANGVTDNDVVDIQVFAIEMVYVPQGSFQLGSGGSEGGHFYKYPTTTDTYPVESDGAITIGQESGNLWGTSNSGSTSIGGAGTLEATFPKGYNAFYCMKYEISQQGYVDFLNTLTYTQQATRTAIAPNSAAGTYIIAMNNYRDKIKISTSGVASTTPAIYATDNPYVACNYLKYDDVAAYLDWSGLRPMTELEFEKACRGTIAAVSGEYAWGNAIVYNTAYTFSGGTTGTSSEVVSNPAGGTTGNSAWSTTATENILGPLRVGSFATSGSDRIVSGATYYGIMEMSGNLWERPITVGITEGRVFTGTHGNGALDATGNADASNWPGTNAAGAGCRGSSWYSNLTYLQVSDRTMAGGGGAYNTRELDYGGRGVRGAFVPYIGQSYCGGIIFYIDGTGQHGLIAAPSNQSTGEWGCEGTTIPGADGTAIGTGNQNTIDIMAGCSTPGIAARLCGDLVLGGYSDWYLPSKDELNQLYINRVVVGGFVTDIYYQSSSESGADYNWKQDFSDGSQFSWWKHFAYNVRAIRAF